MFYTARLTKDDVCGYTVDFPDLDGCFTEGDTLEEALAMAKEAMELTLCDVFDGCPLPEAKTKPDPKNGLYAVEVSPSLSIALQMVAARGKKTQRQMANEMGMHLQAYQRLENPDSNLSVRMLERIAGHLGKKLEVRLV